MKDIAEVLKLPLKIWSAIAVAGTLILIFRQYAIDNFDGGPFFQKFGIFILIVTLVAWSIVGIEVIISIANVWLDRRTQKQRINYVNSLTGEKKLIIKRLYDQPDHVLKLVRVNEHVKELELERVIGLATTQVQFNRLEYFDLNQVPWPYLLQPWVIDGINNGKIKLLDEA